LSPKHEFFNNILSEIGTQTVEEDTTENLHRCQNSAAIQCLTWQISQYILR